MTDANDPETVLIPGGRDVRASLDRADGSDHERADGSDHERADGSDRDPGGDETTACVVACPPHPQHGGTRHDGRLQAVSTTLRDRGIDCLRFDYGAWDGGAGELADVRSALAWASDRYDRVGLFGYSFGGCLALVAAAKFGDAAAGSALTAVSALAPARRVAPDVDAAAAVDRIAVPLQVVYGTRDDTAEWGPVVEAARERAGERGTDAVSVVELEADHFFVGRTDRIGGTVGSWLADRVAIDDDR
ncbi:alpha/beta hydrolase [Halopenitus persicus]|uniref:alpha/beta hydrolase n=1 Tax=Halopenitus persicus TaxID=1048396 RepID=UPI000BBB0949|nr:dienelactone hydrolase family protein [Halopenitus persicus]